ncbi:MAG TPA: succinylglutamate desuccinylase, partial [Burkholderiaceae bacterium]|nr:succinylglutamate desuccinylase [Burkholderiaceae bacterium]
RRIVEGWLDTYAAGVKRRLERTAPSDRANLLSTDPRYGVGTTEYMRTQGGYAITLECGQHDDPAAPEVAYQAICRTLAHLQLIEAADPEPRADIEFLRLTEVIDRYHAGDQFSRPWASYDRVKQGELIGTRHDGALVLAPKDGHIVFPNPAAMPGNEWFYLAQVSTRQLA